MATSVLGGLARSKATNAIQRDVARASVDRGRSAAIASVSYDATQVSETWAATTAWSPNTNMQVAGGYAYKVSGIATGMNQAFSVGLTETAFILAELKVLAPGGTAGLVLVGMSTDAANAAPTAPNIRGIGLESDTGFPIYWGGAAGTNPERLATTALPAGTYTVAITITPTTVSYVLSNSTHSVEYRKQTTRTNAYNNVMVWNTDTRLTSGIGIGSLVIKKAIATAKPPIQAQGVAPWGIYSKTGGASGVTEQRIVVPAGYDSRVGAPLVIFCHGLGGTSLAPFNGSARNFETALVNAGYIFAAADGFSDTHFGRQEAQDEYVRLYRNCRDMLNVRSVVLIGESMGGLVSLNLLGKRSIPGIAAYVGIYPITDLTWARNSNTGWASTLRTIYGVAADDSDWAAKTAAFDPIRRDAADFLSVPMAFWASPADTVVAKAANTDAFATRVSDSATELAVTATSGDHGDASNFTTTQQTALLAFLARHVGG